jgi:acyl-coenzyme A thioesterase PaaI-like protein
MTNESKADRDRNAGDIHGVWEEAVKQLITYRYVGCQSVLHDRQHSTGHMRLRSDMRTPAGLLTAPVAIAMLDAAGNNIDRYYHLGLTQIDVHMFEPAANVNRMRIASTVVREARTQLFTEARFEDDASGRTIGFGSANWAVINPTPDGFVYVDPGPGVPDNPPMPPLTEAYEAVRRAEGGYVIPGLSPRIGTDTLHHGPMLVAMEAAGREAAEAAVGSVKLQPTVCSTRIIRAGRKGPFIITAMVLAISGDTVSCRAELRDEGRDGDIVAIAMWQCRVMA